MAPGDPLGGTLADRLLAPSVAHPFGMDELGRDLFTRVVHGTGTSLVTAGIAVMLGAAIGCFSVCSARSLVVLQTRS